MYIVHIRECTGRSTLIVGTSQSQVSHKSVTRLTITKILTLPAVFQINDMYLSSKQNNDSFEEYLTSHIPACACCSNVST